MGADGSGKKVVAAGAKPPAVAAGDLHGFMRGSVIVPPDLDLTAPTGEDAPTNAEKTVETKRVSSSAL